MIATTIEQSKKLLELGVSYNTSDMYYVGGVLKVGVPLMLSNNIPAWSLSALLKLLPDYKLQTSSDGRVFCVSDHTPTNLYDNPIDAVVVLIEWLITNKYLKV